MPTAKSVYTCCFLDGLDEYNGERDLLRHWILELNSRENIKICVSSRPEEPYLQSFRDMPQLRLQDFTHHDIQLYIHGRLGSRLFEDHDCTVSDCQQHSDVSDCPLELIGNLQSKASGVFLWVRLVVNILLVAADVGDSVHDLQQKLEETPTEMHDLYTNMLDKLPKKYIELAARYFAMVLAAEQVEEGYLTAIEVALVEESSWQKFAPWI